MQKKYLIFISSSQEDLKTERKELAKIITEMGAIPILLDEFDITEAKDRRIIHKIMQECDYFLNLTAHKGGKVVGKTFALELEYTYAVKAGVPVISLIIGEKARKKGSKKEKDDVSAKALAAFKKKLENHSHDTWTNPTDLKLKALGLLSREMNLNPRPGWIPCDEAFSPSVANELSRLIRENELLRGKIAIKGTGIAVKIRDQIKNVIKVLAANRISLSFFYVDGVNWENTKVFRYLRLFKLLAPELSTPKTAADIAHFLGNILNPDLSKIVRKDFPTPSNTIKKIMTDFTLLKLVKYTEYEQNEAWEMTEYGRETFAIYRLRQMSKMTKRNNPKEAVKPSASAKI